MTECPLTNLVIVDPNPVEGCWVLDIVYISSNEFVDLQVILKRRSFQYTHVIWQIYTVSSSCSKQIVKSSELRFAKLPKPYEIIFDLKQYSINSRFMAVIN